jgi:threonine dehydratase
MHSAGSESRDRRRIAVEHGAATALAALLTGAYTPAPGETVAVVLCGANTDPADLTAVPAIQGLS